MAGEDDSGAILDQVLDGGDGGADPGVIGDVLVVVERHIKVGPHEHLLPLQGGAGQVAHALLGHGHDPSAPLAPQRSELGSHMSGQERVGSGEAQAAEAGGAEAGGAEVEESGARGGG